MPEEGLQRHIGGVGNRQIIAHRLTRHDLRVAAFGDGDAQFDRLIISRELDDLSRVPKRHIKGFSREPIIGRSRYLADKIAAQRQGFGCCNASGVGGDIVHHLAAAFPYKLIGRSLERRSAILPGNWAGGFRVFCDLDLPRDGRVLPCDLRDLAAADINRLALGIRDIALIFEFTQVVASSRQALEADTALIIATFLRNGIIAAIIE